MFCPKCAQPSTDEQKFCRHCGFSLQEIAPIVAQTSSPDQPSHAIAEPSSFSETEAQKRERRFKRAAGLLVLSFFLWIVLLAAQDIPGLSPAFKQILRYLSVPFFALALPLGLYLGIKAFALWQFGELSERNLPKTKDLPPARETAPLPPANIDSSFDARPEPMPSVTERTTDLLK